MKRLYLILFIASLLGIISSMILPASTGLPIEKRLFLFQEHWKLDFDTHDHTLNGLTKETGKDALLAFLINHRYEREHMYFIASIIVMIFSLLGLCREEYLEQKSKIAQ